VGWQQQHDYLWARYADAAPWERVPQVMWRGRIADGEHPDRDSLRCVLGFRGGMDRVLLALTRMASTGIATPSGGRSGSRP